MYEYCMYEYVIERQPGIDAFIKVRYLRLINNADFNILFLYV